MKPRKMVSLQCPGLVNIQKKVIQYYRHMILESRLILDEDLDFILEQEEKVEYNESTKKAVLEPVHKLALGVVGFLTGLSYQLRNQDILGYFLMAPNAAYALLQLYFIKKERDYRDNIVVLLKQLRDLKKTTKEIEHYISARQEVMSRDANSTKFIQLMNAVVDHKTNATFCLVEGISYFMVLTTNDEAYSIIDFDLSEVFNPGGAVVNSVDKFQEILSKLTSCQQLFQSKLLTYIAMSCTSKFGTHEAEMSYFVDALLPDICFALSTHVSAMKSDFLKIKIPSKVTTVINRTQNKFLSQHRLRTIIDKSTLNVSFIVEKYRCMQQVLEKAETLRHMVELETYIVEIRREARELHDTLENLEKLFDFINRRKSNTQSVKNSSGDTLPVDQDSPPRFVECERFEPLTDEEFEITVGREDLDNVLAIDYSADDEAKPVPMLIAELRMALRQNQHFRDRRSRFKITDAEPNNAEDPESPKSIPRTRSIIEAEIPPPPPSLTSVTSNDSNADSKIPPPPPPMPNACARRNEIAFSVLEAIKFIGKAQDEDVFE